MLHLHRLWHFVFIFFINEHVTSIFHNNQPNKLYYYLLYLFWLRFLTSLIFVCVACFRTVMDISYLSILEYKKIINIKSSFLYSDVCKKGFLISKSERRVYNFHERVKYVFCPCIMFSLRNKQISSMDRIVIL